MKKEIEISILDFIKYEDCRESGLTNMFDIRNVMMITGLNKEKIVHIIKNYEELIKKYY